LSIKLFLSVFLITFVFYSKSLSFSFVWDDFANFNTLSQMSLSDVIKPSPKVISLSTLFASNWRPLTNGIFVLFNNFSPQFAHFINLLAFSLGSGILAIIILKLMKNFLLSLTLSLLFSLHPANVESAVWPSRFPFTSPPPYFPYTSSFPKNFPSPPFFTPLLYSLRRAPSPSSYPSFFIQRVDGSWFLF